jgi:phage tail sheath protein FI
MPIYTTPGVYFETIDTSRKGITAIRTDVAAFVGIAARGPLHEPTPVKSWEQFRATFGGFIPNGYLAYVVKAFFENGGQVCYVVRVAADATAAQAVLLDENGAQTLGITASSPGRWGNGLSVRVGRSSLAATRSSSSAPQPAGGLASVVESVVGFPVGSLVKVFQERVTAAEEHRIVKAVDPLRNRLTWNESLGAAYDLTRPISFETLDFSLTVYHKGRIQEVFPGLSLVETHGRYVEQIVNEQEPSTLIRVEDLEKGLESPSPWPARLPDVEAANLSRGVVKLKDGRDGIAALQPEHFGDPGAVEKWGLRTLEDVDPVAIVAIPDVLIQPTPLVKPPPQPKPEPNVCLGQEEPVPVAEPPAPQVVEQPPRFSRDQIFAVQQALVAHCEEQGDRMALLDPPVSCRPSDLVDLGEIQSWRQRFDTKYAALYYPWVLVYDPLGSGNRLVRAVPPSGHVAGIFARTDVGSGVHKAPANAALRWAQDVTAEVSAEMQGVLNPIGVNCIRSFPGRGLRLYGARTVSSDPDWRYVNVRRLMMMIEEAVEEAVQWAVFEPNDFYLRQTLTMAISNFLAALWARGALVGETAAEAFFVKCDGENNPPAVVDLGQLIADVGVAPVRPAEFVVFRIGRTEDELEIVEMRGR